jgi:transposase
MEKKYIVRLTAEERKGLENLVAKGSAAAYRIRHANILLKADADGPAWPDERVADAFGCHAKTVRNLRQRFVERGLETALWRKKQAEPSRKRILDGRAEAHLIALSCSNPPPGRVRWTLSLLADKLVELEIVEAVSDQTVRRTLKKTSSSRTCVSAG